MPIRRFVPFSGRLFPAAMCLAFAVCRAQTGDLATFGTTVVAPGGLMGKIYVLKPYTWVLPNFEQLEPIGTIYAKGLYIRPRDFREGFPGITDRVEWFAIDFTGRFYIANPGDYRFEVESDDGSKLYIDRKLVVDNDGDHPALARSATVNLTGGIHYIRLSYFQGPGSALALMLSVSAPGDRKPRPFNTDDFKPPSNPEDWKYGTPEDWKESPDPHLLRRSLKEAVASHDSESVPVPVQVFSHDKPVRNLKQSDFLIYDNNEPKDIASLGFEDQFLDIMLLIEDSAGMRPFRNRIGSIAMQAISKLDRRDHLGVIVFGNTQLLAIGLCARPDRVTAAIQRSPSRPGVTDLNGAIAVAAQYLRDNARTDAARAIVILTLNDGRREISDRATRDALWQANVTLSGLIAHGSERTGEADIRPLIDATGGDMLEMDRKNVPLGEIFQRLRERYSITYRAPEGLPKTIHTLSVDLTPEAKARLQDYRIRVRGGYVIEAR